MNNKLFKIYDGRNDTQGGIEVIDEELYNKIKNCNLSPSMVNSFLKCPADWLMDKYMLPEIEHEEQPALERGTAFHKIMEHFFSLNEDERTSSALAALTAQTVKTEFPDVACNPDSVEWIKNAIRGYLKMGFDYQDDVIPNVKIGNREPKIGLELFVSAKFGTSHKVLGFIDKLAIQNADSKNPIMIMQDWKTGAKFHTFDINKPESASNSFDYWRQQTLYAMMLEKAGINIKKAYLVFPVANRIDDVDFSNKLVQEKAVSDVQELDSRLTDCTNKNFFPFTPAKYCTWCHLLYAGRMSGKNYQPKININELNQFIVKE